MSRDLIAGRGILLIERRRALRKSREHMLPAIDALLDLVEDALAAAYEPPRRDFAPTQFSETALAPMATRQMGL